MIQRIVKTDLTSLTASPKITSNRLFVNELISFLEWERNLREKCKTDSRLLQVCLSFEFILNYGFNDYHLAAREFI